MANNPHLSGSAELINFDRSRIRVPRIDEQAAWRPIHCGWCDRSISGAVIALDKSRERLIAAWLQCPACLGPSVIALDGQAYPRPLPGTSIAGLPADIAQAWTEARKAAGAGAPAAAILLCRKILSHIAVDKGAPQKATFAEYIAYLVDNHHVTPAMGVWVDQIRQAGNESTHDLVMHTDLDAASILAFTEQLLNIAYAMPVLAAKYSSPPQGT